MLPSIYISLVVVVMVIGVVVSWGSCVLVFLGSVRAGVHPGVL